MRHRDFLVRLALASAIFLGSATSLADGLIPRLLPWIRAEILLVLPNLTVASLTVSHDGSGNTVNLLADLDHPWYRGDRPIDPLSWQQGHHGYYRVQLSAPGVLLGPLTLLIVICGWPARRPVEMAVRLAIALPLLALLFALDTPLDIAGSFQHAVLHHAGLEQSTPLFGWAKFLEGGGSEALALAFAVGAIAAAGRIPGSRGPSTGH